MYWSCVTSRCWASKGSKAKKCMCVRAFVFTQHCHHLFCFAMGIENILLCSVCFQPFPQQVSSDTRHWCLIHPTQRARWKTVSLPWETVWPKSLTQTWQQLSTHSSQGQLSYFVHVRSVELCNTQLWQFLQKKKKLCKNLWTQQYIHTVWKWNMCPQFQSYNLGMRKVNVDIMLRASFFIFFGELLGRLQV